MRRGGIDEGLPLILAIDGGNSKTDLVLAGADGSLVAFARGPLSSPHHLGLDGTLRVLSGLLDDACEQAGIGRAGGPVAEVAEVLLAGLDLPVEEETFSVVMERHGWARRTIVGNDTLAVLRAGTDRGWGVAVVCGAGINCLGVAPDGRRARFAALGPITGDWGGGLDVGLAALSAAARSEDGRGPDTLLERLVPVHFGLQRPLELAEAVHFERIALHRLSELAPLVLAHADDDPACAGIVDRLAHEVAAFACAALTRLGLSRQPVQVILGGGLLRSGDHRLLSRIGDELHEAAPQADVCVSDSSPIVGAALLALDELGAGPAAHERLRAELGDAVREHIPLVAASTRLEEPEPVPASLRGKTDG